MPTKFALFVFLVLIVLGVLDQVYDWGVFVLAMKNLLSAIRWLAFWR